jgi:hypothetical protein
MNVVVKQNQNVNFMYRDAMGIDIPTGFIIIIEVWSH